MAAAKASAALAALKPGYSAQDLVSVLNFDIINFQSGSATIPTEGTDFLNKAAVAMRGVPAGTVIRVGTRTIPEMLPRICNSRNNAPMRSATILSSREWMVQCWWPRGLEIRNQSQPTIRRKASSATGGLSFQWPGRADVFVQLRPDRDYGPGSIF